MTTPTLRLTLGTVAATVAYLGLAVLGWGGFAAFFSHPALTGVAIVTFVLSGAALCLVSIAFAFSLNPTSAELGNAVDRRGLSCYAAVYAVYNIAYSIGMIATSPLNRRPSTKTGQMRKTPPTV